jgi:hypothetical protein
MNKIYISRKSKLLITWIVAAIFFGTLLSIAEISRNPLDDPDFAYQRTGFLIAPHTVQAPKIYTDLPRSGHKMVVFFTRSMKDMQLFHDLATQSDLSLMADLVLITSDGSKPTVTEGLKYVEGDPKGKFAELFGMDKPIDGGPPVGYVVIDSEGYTRYRTLDPRFMHRRELVTILKATP